MDATNINKKNSKKIKNLSSTHLSNNCRAQFGRDRFEKHGLDLRINVDQFAETTANTALTNVALKQNRGNFFCEFWYYCK